MNQAQFDALPFLLTRSQVLSVDAQLWEWKVKLARQTGALRTWKVDEHARWHRYLKADVAPLAGARMNWDRVEGLAEVLRFEEITALLGLNGKELCRAVHAGLLTMTCFGCLARYPVEPIWSVIGFRQVRRFGSRGVDGGRVLTTDWRVIGPHEA